MNAGGINSGNVSENSSMGKSMTGTVFCFGELLLRLSPSLNGKWIQQAQMPVYIGGAELNVATALAQWNMPVNYCTVLPDHYLSAEIIEEVAGKKIGVSPIQLAGDRIGTYYLPQGADLKHAGVVYDRAHSSFSQLQPGMIDWDKLLEGCSWFHFSAISPALNKNVAAVCEEALKKAADKNLTISVDLNYRSKLWQYGIAPDRVMPGLMQYCQVIMGNLWSAETLLGIPSPIKESTGKTREELIEATGKSMLSMHKQYPGASSFAYTFRLEKEYWAVLQQGPEMAVSQIFPIGNVIDKVGSGDCFMGGLIYGLINEHATQDTIDFAAAAAVGKLHETGDATRQTTAMINERIKQNTAGSAAIK